jgi:hypothetical protein
MLIVDGAAGPLASPVSERLEMTPRVVIGARKEPAILLA